MIKPLTTALAFVLVLVACSVPPMPDPLLEKFPPFSVIDQGTHSGMTLSKQLVITHAADWQELWRIHSNKPQPQIDFTTDMVIAVFLGERPTGGYQVAVQSLEKTGKHLLVKLHIDALAHGAITTMALTQPYVIIKTARSPLPVNFVM